MWWWWWLHRLHVAYAFFSHLKICLDSERSVRDSFSSQTQKCEDRNFCSVFIYSTLTKPPPMCTYTNFIFIFFVRRKENFMFNFFSYARLHVAGRFSLLVVLALVWYTYKVFFSPFFCTFCIHFNPANWIIMVLGFDDEGKVWVWRFPLYRL